MKIRMGRYAAHSLKSILLFDSFRLASSARMDKVCVLTSADPCPISLY